MVVVDKKEKSCKIIDFAVPGDNRIEEKEKDKIEKYQDSGRELQKIWNVKVKIIPLVFSSIILLCVSSIITIIIYPLLRL